jgi:hypothetical protein
LREIVCSVWDSVPRPTRPEVLKIAVSMVYVVVYVAHPLGPISEAAPLRGRRLGGTS